MTITAVVATDFGGPEVLALQVRDLRTPTDDQVRLSVRAAGVNPYDWKLYSGMMGTDAPLPLSLGAEVSGVVVEAGSRARGPAGTISVGDEVIAFSVDGGYATEVVTFGDSCVPKPSGMSFAAAGGLMQAGTAAIHLLTATAVAAGDTILVHGAAGGVGRIVVQAAVARGAEVIGTAGEPDHARLREFGAEPILYGAGLADRVKALAPQGIDAALDCVGTDEAVDVSVQLVQDRSRIATLVAFERGATVGIKLLGFGPGSDPGTEVRSQARLQLTDLVNQGRLVIDVTTYPLAEAAQAHRDGQAGQAHGKLILVPSQPK
jgi:NADPH2:quinone reductase